MAKAVHARRRDVVVKRRDFLSLGGAGLAIAAAPVVLARRFWPGADLVRPTGAQIVSITINGRFYPVDGGAELTVFTSWNKFDHVASLYNVHRLPCETDAQLECRVIRHLRGGPVRPTFAYQNDRHRRA